MTDPIRRLRGLGIALAVLALSAGAVFANSPIAKTQTLPSTAQVPAQASEDQETPDVDETEAPETEAPDAEETAGADAQGVHGGFVSTAAQSDTPAAFANHGAFVSCVARMDDAALATATLADLTPDACPASGADNEHATAGKTNADTGKTKAETGKANATLKAAAGKAHSQKPGG